MAHDDLRLFDVRTLERKLRRGLITKKDYEKFLKSLPDVAENAQPLRIFGNESDDDEGDEAEE